MLLAGCTTPNPDSPEPAQFEEGSKDTHSDMPIGTTRLNINSLIDSANINLTRDPLKALAFIDKATLLAQENQLWDLYLKIQTTSQLSYWIYYNKAREWKQQLVKIDSLIDLQHEYLGGQAALMENENQVQWAIYYSYLGYDQKATDLLSASLVDLEGLPLDSANAFNLHYNSLWLASLYKKRGAFESSIQENERALILLDQYRQFIRDPDRLTESAILTSIAEAYLQLGDTTQADEYFKRAEKDLARLRSNPKYTGKFRSHSLNFHTNIAKYYQFINRYDLSLASLKKIEAHLKPDDPFWGENLLAIGDVHLHLQEYEAAVAAYLQAKEVAVRKYGTKNYRAARANLKLARLFSRQQEWEKAVKFYQSAIDNVVLDFAGHAGELDNPEHLRFRRIVGATELLQALDGKTEALLAWHGSNRDGTMLLKAWDTNQLSVALIDSMKNELYSEKDRQFLVANHYRIYEKGLSIAEALYRETQQSDYLESAFNLSERSKSLGLLAVFQPAPAENSLEATMVEEEKQIKFELARRKQELLESGLSINEDSLYLQLQYQFARWLHSLGENQQKYWNFTQVTEVLSTGAIKKRLLKSKRALIEYFWGEKFLFTIVVSSRQMKIYKKEIDLVADSILQLREMTLNPGWFSNIGESLRFQRLAHHVYSEILREPLEELGRKCNRLTIVRDGLLEYLPFELLDISSRTTPGILPWSEYLVSQYHISYAHSATLLQLKRKLKRKKAPSFFGGFAPTYPPIPKEGIPPKRNVPLYAGPYELGGNRVEVERIASILDGHEFLGEAATESKFKTSAANYDILHLAMHAIANDQQPELSELVFTQPNMDNRENGRLRAVELYNLQLNARMVVLGACSTGFGKLLRGEGMLSLGQAFSYAGVPSLVASSWNVDDASSVDIMTRFYQNLQKGMAKDEALAKAKVSLMKDNHLMTHPFYWAPFVVAGDVSPLRAGTPTWLYLLGIFVLLAAVVGLYRYYPE